MNFPEIYTLVLILASIIGGIINIFQLISFLKQSKSRFLRSRNPPLIISFAIISIISAFITSPLDFYLNIFDHRVYFNIFAVEFVHELCTVCLYVIIVCRLCLLYYDYKFNEASANQIWRDLVNPNDNNFWLTHRKTFGNLQFMTCVALIIVSLSLVILLFIGFFVLERENSHLFHFFTVIGLGFPFVAFIFYLVSFKIAEINDIYFIYSEMKYLSFCMVARIICFLIDEYFLNKYDKYLLFYSSEMLTNFLAVYIQCNWVINQLKKQDDAMNVYEAAEFEEKTKAKVSIRNLEMIDLFNEKLSFEQFIRHCTNELSVESVLFLVEIAQFKASLNRYNVGIQSIVYRQIDVIKANLVSFIWKERQNKRNKKLIIHAVHVGDNSNGNIPTPSSPPLSPPPLSPKSASISKSRSPSPPSPFAIATLKKANSNTTLAQIAQIATVKQENVYKEFQDNILSKTWLPIAMPLLSSNQFNEDYDSEFTKTRTRTKSRTKTETKTITKSGPKTPTKSSVAARRPAFGKSFSYISRSGMTNGTTTPSSQRRSKRKKKFPKLSHDIDDSLSTSKLSENNFISPISLAIIDSNANRTNTLNEEEKKENAHAFNIKYKNKKKRKKRLGLSIDIHWMYEYSRHLFVKYIDRDADLSINVSHCVRKPLWDVFSKEFSDEAFQKIMLTHHKALNKIHLSPNDEIMLIQTYLYHAFDIAFDAVWKLLKRDTFFRFQKTKQYQILCKDINAEKLQGQRDQNERIFNQYAE